MGAAYLKGPPALPSTQIPHWCMGKHAYESATVAVEVAQRSPHNLSTYRCLLCGRFHVGSSQRAIHRTTSKIAKELIR